MALLQYCGRLEDHHSPRRDRNFFARLRVAADALTFFANDKRAKRRQLHRFATLETVSNFLEYQFDKRSRFGPRQADFLVNRLT